MKSGIKWRWAGDRWDSRDGLVIKWDKVEHGLSYAGLACLLTAFGVHGNYVWLWLMTLGMVWEIKDALFPSTKYGMWGGDGFSIRDLAANIFGIFIGIGLGGMI